MTRPTDGFPEWSSVGEQDPITGAPNKDQPSTEFQRSGLKIGEPLFRGHLNWQFDSLARWIQYLDEQNTALKQRVVDLGG